MKSKIISGPIATLPFGPKIPVATLDFVLDYGWANTGAFVFFGSVETLDNSESLSASRSSKPKPLSL
jgi:hypothetical protein